MRAAGLRADAYEVDGSSAGNGAKNRLILFLREELKKTAKDRIVSAAVFTAGKKFPASCTSRMLIAETRRLSRLPMNFDRKKMKQKVLRSVTRAKLES
jgi:hypothetical protein